LIRVRIASLVPEGFRGLTGINIAQWRDMLDFIARRCRT